MGKKKEGEEKVSKGAGKNWWELSKVVPEDKLDIVLWAGGGAAVLFLILWIVWIGVASGRGSRLAEAEDKLGARPEAAEMNKWKQKAKEEEAARKDTVKQVQQLQDDLELAKKEKDSLGSEFEELGKRKEAEKGDYEKRLAGVRGELSKVSAEYDRLRELAPKAEALGNDLEQTKQALARSEDEVAKLREESKRTGSELTTKVKDLERIKGESESKIAELSKAIEEQDERIKELRLKIAKYPGKPLVEEEAKTMYLDIQDEVANLTDRDERISAYFDAKRILAGTKYERKANGLWNKEKKLKQQAIDKAALGVFKEATGKIREHPLAYDENIELLRDIVDDVSKSERYTKAVEKAIKKEVDKKAAAAARAAKDAAAAEAAAAAAEEEAKAEAEAPEE